MNLEVAYLRVEDEIYFEIAGTNSDFMHARILRRSYPHLLHGPGQLLLEAKSFVDAGFLLFSTEGAGGVKISISNELYVSSTIGKVPPQTRKQTKNLLNQSLNEYGITSLGDYD